MISDIHTYRSMYKDIIIISEENSILRMHVTTDNNFIPWAYAYTHTRLYMKLFKSNAIYV